MKHLVCDYDELKQAGIKAVTVDRKQIVLVRSKTTGEVFALRDVCPHKGPCLSLGAVDHGTAGNDVGEYMLDGNKEIIRCPWHGWGFDIRTGTSDFDPERVRVKTYEVTVEDNKVFVEV